MPRVVHFEMIAKKPEESGKFWADVFDWQIEKWDGPQPYWMAMTGEDKESGINGGIMGPSDGFSDLNSVCVVEVSSIDDTAEKIEEAGGTEVKPKMAVGEMGWAAYYKDTGGVIFGIWESNPAAEASGA